MSGPLRALLIGAGNIGFGAERFSEASHLGALLRHPGVEVCGVVEPVPERRELVLAEVDVPVFPELYPAAATEPDLVVVASPDDTHEEVLREVVSWMPRMVLCEKPLSPELPSARSLVSLFQERQVPLHVNFTRRFMPALDRIRSQLGEGSWGTPSTAVVLFTNGLRHNAIHFLDLLIWWFGPPDGSRGSSVSPILEWENGLLAYFIELPHGKLACNELDLHCELGRIRLTDDRRLLTHGKAEHPEVPTRWVYDRPSEVALRQEDALDRAVDAMVQYVEHGRPAPASATESLVLLEWLDRMELST